MFNIGICDDGKNMCASLEMMILLYKKEKNISIDTNVWHSGEELCNYLKKGNQIDILFLDIELFKLSGIDVGNFIRNELEDRGMQIIYISAKSSYAQQLFKTQPIDFLVKPITKMQIYEVLALAIQNFIINIQKFEFQNGKNYYYIPFEKIKYFESEGRKVKVITSKETYWFYGKLKEVFKRLPSDFIIIHQSIVVNKSYIFKHTYENITLQDGANLEISKGKRKLVRETLFRER